MKVEILRKKIVPAELRLTGNECYIEIFKGVRHMVEEYADDKILEFEDKTTQKVYKFRLFRRYNKKSGNISQVWIKPFTTYKNEKEIQAFDEVIIEKISYGNGKVEFKIDVEKFNSRFELTYNKENEKFQVIEVLQQQFDNFLDKNKINILSRNGEVIRLDINKEKNLYSINSINEIIDRYDYSPIILQLKDKNKNLYEVFKSVKSSYEVIEY